MKQLFFAIAIVSFSFASAQDNPTYWVKPTPKTSLSQSPKVYTLAPNDHLVVKAELLQTLPNGNKVYALAQDHMPCVVPDMSQYNYSMPVLKPNVTYTIPNPAYPSVEPQIRTQEDLNKLLEKYKKQQ